MSTDATTMPARSAAACAKQQIRGGQHDGQDDERAELEADVVGHERGDRMRSGELQRFLQRDREAETVKEAEDEGDDPPMPQKDSRGFLERSETRPDPVFDRHVHERQRDQRRRPSAQTTCPAAPCRTRARTSVIECAMANAMNGFTRSRTRRNGSARMMTNSRWSRPSRKR